MMALKTLAGINKNYLASLIRKITICLLISVTPTYAQEAAAQSHAPSTSATSETTTPPDPSADLPVYTPLTESQTSVSMGSGLQRVPHRFRVAVGGGSTVSFGPQRGNRGGTMLREQGTQAVGSLQAEVDLRHARLTLDIQGGNPVLRIAGQAQVLPVSLILRAPVEHTTNATYINLQLIPLTAQGHFFMEELTRGSISVSPEIAFQILNANGGNITVGGVSLASARVATGASFGTINEPLRAPEGQEQVDVVAAPYVSAEGRLNINLRGAFGIELSAAGRLTHDVQQALTMWNAGASVGVFYGLPFGLRGNVNFVAQFQGAAWEPRTTAATPDSSEGTTTAQAIDGFAGMTAAVAF